MYGNGGYENGRFSERPRKCALGGGKEDRKSRKIKDKKIERTFRNLGLKLEKLRSRIHGVDVQMHVTRGVLNPFLFFFFYSFLFTSFPLK